MSTSIKYQWPDDFVDGVPIEEAKPATGKAYRLVKQVPPTEDDFLQHNVEKPNYTYPDELRVKQGFGVSMWSTLNQVKRAGKNYPAPKQLGNWLITSGELVEDLGVIHKRKGHICLWKQKGAKPHLHINSEEH